MKKMTVAARWLAIALSAMAGVAAFLFLIKGLAPLRLDGYTAAFTNYAFLVTNTAASLIAGFWVGRLVHFLLWECFSEWLGSMWLNLKIKSQPLSGANPDQTVEQAL